MGRDQFKGDANLGNNNRFPDGLFHPRLGSPEEHFTGLIWGGACWSLREQIGARYAMTRLSPTHFSFCQEMAEQICRLG